MALRTVILGWEAAVFFGGDRVSGTPFGVKEGRIQVQIDEQECGDSRTAQAKAHKPGRYCASVNLGFLDKWDIATTQTGPIAIISIDSNGIMTAELVNVYIYQNYNSTVPLGVAPKAPWIFPSLVSNDYSDGWNMDGKFEGSFTAKSNGIFTPG